MAKVVAAHTPANQPDPRIEALVNDLIGRVASKWTMLILKVLAEKGELLFTRLRKPDRSSYTNVHAKSRRKTLRPGISPLSVVTPKSTLKSLSAEETQGMLHPMRSRYRSMVARGASDTKQRDVSRACRRSGQPIWSTNIEQPGQPDLVVVLGFHHRLSFSLCRETAGPPVSRSVRSQTADHGLSSPLPC
jgi:hypothetical protein